MRILIIADDAIFSRKLKNSLRQVPFSIDTPTSKEQGQYWARTTKYDLIIVEHSPSCNALVICDKLRESGLHSILLVATEEISSQDAIALFNFGVDDYISKFSPTTEIIARVKALLRRPRIWQSEKFSLGDLIIDCQSYTVTRNKKSIHLTKKEFGLLEYLLKNQNKVISRSDLIEHVWDINADLFSNSLETHILNLRKKIEAPNKPKLIHTVSGRGYKIALQT